MDEIPFLSGFRLGNSFVPGCLTADESSRVHSCGPEFMCASVAAENAVFITPVVTRTQDGSEVPEVGAGGGVRDLYQSHELELSDKLAIGQLERLCREQIEDTRVLSWTKEVLASAFKSKDKTLLLDQYGVKGEDDISLKELVTLLGQGPTTSTSPCEHSLASESFASSATEENAGNVLAKSIRFPYSRHSSYMELCELVSAFKPKDVYPCTVNLDTWSEDVSMQSLFGHLCSGDEFSHDQYMREAIGEIGGILKKTARHTDSSSRTSTQESGVAFSTSDENGSAGAIVINNVSLPLNGNKCNREDEGKDSPSTQSKIRSIGNRLEEMKNEILFNGKLSASQNQRTNSQDDRQLSWDISEDEDSETDTTSQCCSPIIIGADSQLSLPDSAFDSQEEGLQTPLTQDSNDADTTDVRSNGLSIRTRKAAYDAARSRTYDAWSQVALLSAGNNHTEAEIEL
jgi:hypothetical protein